MARRTVKVVDIVELLSTAMRADQTPRWATAWLVDVKTVRKYVPGQSPAGLVLAARRYTGQWRWPGSGCASWPGAWVHPLP